MTSAAAETDAPSVDEHEAKRRRLRAANAGIDSIDDALARIVELEDLVKTERERRAQVERGAQVSARELRGKLRQLDARREREAEAAVKAKKTIATARSGDVLRSRATRLEYGVVDVVLDPGVAEDATLELRIRPGTNPNALLPVLRELGLSIGDSQTPITTDRGTWTVVKSPQAPAPDEDDFALRRYSIPEAEPLIAAESDLYRLLLWREADDRKGIRAAVEARVDELLAAADERPAEGERFAVNCQSAQRARSALRQLDPADGAESAGEGEGDATEQRRTRTRYRAPAE